MLENVISDFTLADGFEYLLYLVLIVLLWMFIHDVLQKGHAIQRNYPVVGHFRYMFENMGEYFRQYWFMGDR